MQATSVEREDLPIETAPSTVDTATHDLSELWRDVGGSD